MIYLKKPIAYLINDDFDKDGNLVHPKIPKEIPTVIMIQAKFCGYCTQAKPAFQDFASKMNGKIFTATIEGDGEQPGEKELGSRIKKIDPTFRGYPHYIAYKNGKFLKTHTGGRTVDELEKFANSL
jgi:thiol-disulfide isomerase/thioredoxin